MIEIAVEAPTPMTSRVRQVAALLDVPIAKKMARSWRHDLPLGEHEWKVGLIVGPSGAGKSLLARALADEMEGGYLAGGYDWGDDTALVDGFPQTMGVKEVTGLLTAVGLGDAPAWLRPYRTLSNGEAFRADMARALSTNDGVLFIDEFTSVVDRQVARVASHAVQKAVRRSGNDLQFVAVSCHYDVEAWLQPDWMYDVAAQVFTWRLVQPHPPLKIDIHEAPRTLWSLFAPHHYLSATLATGAHCYAAYVDDRPIAFTSYIHFPHAKTRNIKMEHRTVVLPDWQGLGIAGRLTDWLGLWLFDRGYRLHRTIAHPAVIHQSLRSPRWREISVRKSLGTTTKNASLRAAQLDPRRLNTRSFEYQAPTGSTFGRLRDPA